MYLPDLAVLLVNAAYLPRDDEPRRYRQFEQVMQAHLLLYAVKPLFGRFKLLGKLLPPSGMREVAGADKPDTLSPRPQVQVGNIGIFPRCARIFGMNMQISQIHAFIIPLF